MTSSRVCTERLIKYLLDKIAKIEINHKIITNKLAYEYYSCMRHSSRLVKVCIIISTVVLLSSCQKESKSWMGFFHPEGKTECISKEFTTNESCEDWGNAQMNEVPNSDYFCGNHCVYNNCNYICDAKTDE